MGPELRDLAVLSVVTALMWVPYILDRMRVRGLAATLGNPRDDAVPLSPWAQRAKRAHANAVENLVVFAALVMVAHGAGVHTETTALATTSYVWIRIAHYLLYTAGIPVARTASFLAGVTCQLMLAVEVLG